MKRNKYRRLWLPAALVMTLALLVTIPASAAVWTDKPDYQPGETVTISGVSYEANQYIPGETVQVVVTGPNAYLQQCLAADGLPPVVAGDGSWSCQVVLYADERAFGDYTYTADGVSSLVHEEGSFTDQPSSTRLIYLGPTSGEYGEDVTVQAALQYYSCHYDFDWIFPIYHCDWNPLPWKTIGFTLGWSTLSGVTDGNGVATASFAAPMVDVDLTVNYAGENYCIVPGFCFPAYLGSQIALQFHSTAGSSNDPFNSTQGTVIDSHNTIVDPINAFRLNGGFEDGNTLMGNFGLGSWSYIDFHTASPVSISGVELYAHNDEAGCCLRRAMSGFRLYADQNNDGLLESTPVIERFINPDYNSVPDNLAAGIGDLDLILLTNGVVTAQVWRLEIQQGSNWQPFEGARLVELDAIAAPPNTAPTVSLTGPNSANEGQAISYAYTTLDPDSTSFNLASGYPSCGTNGLISDQVFDTTTGNGSFNCTFPDGPASDNASVQVIDQQGASSNIAASAVAIENVAPSVAAGNNPVIVDEGQSATNSGTYSDPGADTVTLSPVAGLVDNGNGTWSWSFDSCDGPDESQEVIVTATDSDGASSTAIFQLAVNNLPPVISAITSPIEPIGVGVPMNISASFTDAGTCDTHSATIDWGDGNIDNLNPYTSGTTASHTYIAAGVYQVGVTVTDDDGDSDTESSEWVVIYDPSAGFVTGGGWIMSPEGAYYPADLLLFDGSYYRVVSNPLNWADANNAASLSELEGCSSAHLATITSQLEQDAIYNFFGGDAIAFAWLGAHLVDGEWHWTTGEAWNYTNWQLNEPSGGGENALMVGGGGTPYDGGWIYDGKWNDTPDTNLLEKYVIEYEQCSAYGKATFGFVSKYQKGSNVPTGNTEFQFHNANLNFHSTSYEWLVVTGSNYAKFKGEGTINGEGSYKFMIWAGDGNGLNGADTFRIKIWTEVDGLVTIIYDNGMDQPISGGSIVVHSN